jgi:chaperonin cofactor prefoldin
LSGINCLQQEIQRLSAEKQAAVCSALQANHKLENALNEIEPVIGEISTVDTDMQPE